VGDNTDTILLIRIPNNGKSATAISIPRDSYVDVPGLGMSKINAAFGATKETKRIALVKAGKPDAEANKVSAQAGRQALIGAVASLTGITVDHYAEVGLLGFSLLTDAVGGVEVCLNNAVQEPLSGANFRAGRQTLRGGSALSFVRQRHGLPHGDLDRIVRQQVFMAELARKVLSAKTLSDPGSFSQLSDAVTRSVVIDSDWDIMDFAKRLKDLAGGSVRFQTIPVTDLNGSTDAGESVVRVDPAAVQRYVAGLLGDSSSGPGRQGVDPGSVTVDVINDSGIDGLASKVAQALSSRGFNTGTVGNNSGADVDTTRLLAPKSDDEKAAAVAKALGGIPVKEDKSLPPGAVRLVLATDYAGPGSAGYMEFSPSAPGSGTPVPAPPPISAGQSGPKCVD
jgi:LCP family protein required for cell wall assembly